MLNILIYGDEKDKDVVLKMLEASPSISYRQKKYIYHSDYDDYLQALKECEPELIIVIENGEQGRCAVNEALKVEPEVARLWFSDNKGYVTESYDLQCTWFAPKPLKQEILDKALAKFNGVTLTQKDKTT